MLAFQYGCGGSSGSGAGEGGGSFLGGVAFACDAPGFEQPEQTGLLSAEDLLTVRYLRIFSRRFLPRPLMASRSSTLLKAPWDWRMSRIFSAGAGRSAGEWGEVLRWVGVGWCGGAGQVV